MNAEPKPRELVLLLHGLGRTSRVFWRLAPALRRAGYEVRAHDYPSRQHSVRRLTEMFRRHLSRYADHPGPIHFVGHSLGAILIRGALLAPAPVKFGRVVMIGPPNNGAGFLGRMARRPWLRLMYGPAPVDLQEGSEYLRELGVPDTEIGVIAGTDPFFAFNPASWFNQAYPPGRPHDGTIEVENTRLDGMADFIALPVNHTLMCQHPEIMRQTAYFLRRGEFDHAEAQAAPAAE
ncbi:MAG: alpha/beta fold hydrolase [Alphaproteobacteria bacterium]